MREHRHARAGKRREPAWSGATTCSATGDGNRPCHGEAMPDALIVENAVTFSMAGDEVAPRRPSSPARPTACPIPTGRRWCAREVLSIAGARALWPRGLGNLPCSMPCSRRRCGFIRLLRCDARTIRPVTLGGVTLGAGATIDIRLHRAPAPELWPDPLKFHPSRFTAEAAPGRHRCACTPFGAGLRTCVGGGFAMIEGKTMPATSLQHASFALPRASGPRRCACTDSPNYGLKLNVTMLDQLL